jgi:hypothetical protein
MRGLDGGIYGSSLGRESGRDTDESRRKQFVEGVVCGKCAMMGRSNRRCRWNLHRPCAAVQSADHLELLHRSPSRTARQQSYPTSNSVTLFGIVHNNYGEQPKISLRRGLSNTKDGLETLVMSLARALFVLRGSRENEDSSVASLLKPHPVTYCQSSNTLQSVHRRE